MTDRRTTGLFITSRAIFVLLVLTLCTSQVAYSQIYAPRSYDDEEVDSATWRTLRITQRHQDGSRTLITLLRPTWWIDSVGAKEGGTVSLYLPEMGALGPAIIESIGPCPEIEPTRPGERHVIGTFKHENARVLQLFFDNDVKPVEATANHPIWSITRQAFIQAGSLLVGEETQTLQGPIRLVRVEEKPGLHTVHDLEVHKDHVYLVSKSGILVHNTCAPFRDLRGKSLSWIKKQKPKSWRVEPTREHEGWIWKDEAAIERLRFMRPKKGNPANLEWSRQANGYFRWRNEAGDFLDMDGNPVYRHDPLFHEKTHIMYEGPIR